MNTFIHNRTEEPKGERLIMREHRPPAPPIPPHERRSMLRFECDEQDMSLLCGVFGDDDTASAAVEIIQYAPPEIQILFIQLINAIKEVA